MRRSRPSPGPLALAGRAAHDLGLAGLLGGNLFGRLAFHPAVAEISDPAERGRVVNAAWRRYGTVNSLSLLAVAGPWVADRLSSGDEGSGRDHALARVQDGLLAATALSGLATGFVGMRFARRAPHGAVPLQDGSTPAPTASAGAAKLKRALNALGAVNAVAELGLVAVNAARR
ncbi:MAG TPA: hypothetical protein VGI54_00065 [Solirubrobacteraceae bacterium]